MNIRRLVNIIRNSLVALAVTALAASCATQLKDRENLAVAAGFKVITPVKPDQVALLPKLQKDKVSQVKYKGRTYYLIPDQKHNELYVGGQAQYQAYRQLRAKERIADENIEAAQMNQMMWLNSTDWGAWGGWGAWGPGYF